MEKSVGQAFAAEKMLVMRKFWSGVFTAQHTQNNAHYILKISLIHIP